MLKRFLLLLSFMFVGCLAQEAGPSKAPQPVTFEEHQEVKDLLIYYVKENKIATDLNRSLVAENQKMLNDINVFVNELKQIQGNDPELDKVLSKYNIKRDIKTKGK
jgi:uncharacterized protein YcfL